MNLQTQYETVKRTLEESAHVFKNGQPEIVQDILTRVVIECIKKYQEKVSAGIGDSVSDLLDTFKTKVVSDIIDISQNWTVATRRQKVLFPQHCKFLYTLGKNTIVVIEQEPSLRTLLLDSSLLGGTAVVNESSGRCTRHALSLPYVVFILHFVNDKLDGSGDESLIAIYVGWRTRKLMALDDMIYNPIFPNIHTNLSVCLGNDFSISAGGIAQKTEEIITQFWNSRFNNDLSTFWWAKNRIDASLRSVRQWSERSEQDPLFVLGLHLDAADNLENLINRCVSAREEVAPDVDVSTMQHQITDLVNQTSGELFDGILRYLRKTKFERFYPKDIVDNLDNSISKMSDQLTALVISLQIELNGLSEAVTKSHKNTNSFGWEKRGVFWGNY